MPFVCSPDSFYVMDSSYQLLELTSDIHPAAYYSGFNLDKFFDTYDAQYNFDSASPATKALTSLMYNWIDKKNDAERGLILSSNIYESAMQLEEFVGGITNKLIKSYLKNNNIEKEECEFYFIDIENQEDTLYVRTEKDILVPANIGSAIINNNRYFEYINNLKGQLKKAFESDLSLESTRKAHIEFSNQKNNEVVFSQGFIEHQNKFEYLKESKAKKALKKGIKKFSNLFGDNKIQSFISGEGFTVEGKKYNWHFAQRRHVSILSMTHSPLGGHIPYVLTLMTKENLEIANCCVYVANNTPIIDQIITIMLYIQHDESELIENCNLFNERDGFEEIVTEKFNNKKRIKESASELSSFVSEYDKIFSNLNKKFKPLVKEQIAQVIGINNNFFDFLCIQNGNPITGDSRNPLITDSFSNLKGLILN